MNLEFKEWLNEMFDAPVPIHWNKKNNVDWEGNFLINGKKYLIKMMNVPQMGWEVKFELRQGKWTQAITGTGDAATIFSTVWRGIREWIEKIQPASFALSAREPNRIRLYARLLRTLLPRLPNKWQVEKIGGTFFVQDSSKLSGGFDDGFDDYYDDF